MSWDLDAMSVLPEKIQNELVDNFSPESLACALSDHILDLESRLYESSVKIRRLENALEDLNKKLTDKTRQINKFKS